METTKTESQAENEAQPKSEPKSPSASRVYQTHIRQLPASQRLKLIRIIAEDLARQYPDLEDKPLHNIMEFYGVGAENPIGMDAQEYVNELRRG
jgi:hypothetical protein